VILDEEFPFLVEDLRSVRIVVENLVIHRVILVGTTPRRGGRGVPRRRSLLLRRRFRTIYAEFVRPFGYRAFNPTTPREGLKFMGEKIFKTGIKRDNDLMYYIKGGDVWATPRKKPGQPKGKAQKVAAAGIEMDYSKYLYYLDGDGDVARKERQVGGSKRKSKKPAAPKKAPAKKAPAKKAPAKKAPAKKAPAKKAGGKKGKKK
jgi:hypothetical protein